MIKRLLDIVISLIGLICFSPILLFASILVWSNDKKSPFYIPPRVGKKGKIFYMIKLFFAVAQIMGKCLISLIFQ
jgi:lipopolysaccharide/colanic/teichoic acid biosynthesis glycosyltransferase